MQASKQQANERRFNRNRRNYVNSVYYVTELCIRESCAHAPTYPPLLLSTKLMVIPISTIFYYLFYDLHVWEPNYCFSSNS